MTPFEVEVDVPESRQVTVTLPPGSQPGRVRLRIVVAPDPVSPEIPQLSAVLPDLEVAGVRSGSIRVLGPEPPG